MTERSLPPVQDRPAPPGVRPLPGHPQDWGLRPEPSHPTNVSPPSAPHTQGNAAQAGTSNEARPADSGAALGRNRR